jgi:hypothetical protein
MGYSFGTVVLDSGKFGEEHGYPLNGGSTSTIDKCYYKVVMEGRINEQCHYDPNMGGTQYICWFELANVKRTDECKCVPMVCDNGGSEEVSITKGYRGPGYAYGFSFKWCKVYATTEACPPIPYINWCSGKKTTDMGSFRTKSFGYTEGSCASKTGSGGHPIVNLYTNKTKKCEKRLAAFLNEWTLAQAAEHGIPAMCPGPAYN